MAEHSLVGIFSFGTTERKELKYPNIINENSRRTWVKKDLIRESTLQIPKKSCHWGGDSFSVCIVVFSYCMIKKVKKGLI